MEKINKVGKLSIGDSFWYEGVEFKIRSFPTKELVIGEVVEMISGRPSLIKESIGKIKNAPPVSEKQRASFIGLVDVLMKDPYLTADDIKQKVKYWCRFTRLNPKSVIKAMSRVTGFTVHEIMNSTKWDVSDVRFCCAYYFSMKGATQQDIANFFGKGERSTIAHSIRQFSDRIGAGDEKLTQIYNTFVEELKENR